MEVLKMVFNFFGGTFLALLVIVLYFIVSAIISVSLERISFNMEKKRMKKKGMEILNDVEWNRKISGIEIKDKHLKINYIIEYKMLKNKEKINKKEKKELSLKIRKYNEMIMMDNLDESSRKLIHNELKGFEKELEEGEYNKEYRKIKQNQIRIIENKMKNMKIEKAKSEYDLDKVLIETSRKKLDEKTAKVYDLAEEVNEINTDFINLDHRVLLYNLKRNLAYRIKNNKEEFNSEVNKRRLERIKEELGYIKQM